MTARSWAWVMIAIAVGGTLAGIIAYVSGIQSINGFLWEVPIVLMGAAVAAGSSLALGVQRSRRLRLTIASMIAVTMMWMLFGLALFNVDVPGEPGRWPYETASFTIILINTFGMWSCMALPVLALKPRHPLLRVLRRAVLVLGTLLAATWLAFYAIDQFWGVAHDAIKYALILTSIATLGTVLCLPPAIFLDRLTSAQAPKMEVAQVRCPRCGGPCDPNADDCRCAQCQLPIQLDRREPRCACGYLLVNLTGNTCPECGRAFGARVRYELVEV
jgi:hypothetical protein